MKVNGKDYSIPYITKKWKSFSKPPTRYITYISLGKFPRSQDPQDPLATCTVHQVLVEIFIIDIYIYYG